MNCGRCVLLEPRSFRAKILSQMQIQSKHATVQALRGLLQDCTRVQRCLRATENDGASTLTTQLIFQASDGASGETVRLYWCDRRSESTCKVSVFSIEQSAVYFRTQATYGSNQKGQNDTRAPTSALSTDDLKQAYNHGWRLVQARFTDTDFKSRYLDE